MKPQRMSSALVRVYHEELAFWRRLNAEQRGLILAFVWCLDCRLKGIDPASIINRPARSDDAIEYHI